MTELAALLGLLALAAAVAAPPDDAAPDRAGEGTVRLVVEAGPVSVVAVVAEGPASGTYSVAVERGGAAGRSRSRQGRAFTVAAGAADTLSVSRVNAVPGDTLRATLEVAWADGRRTQQTHDEVVAAAGSGE